MRVGIPKSLCHAFLFVCQHHTEGAQNYLNLVVQAHELLRYDVATNGAVKRNSQVANGAFMPLNQKMTIQVLLAHAVALILFLVDSCGHFLNHFFSTQHPVQLCQPIRVNRLTKQHGFHSIHEIYLPKQKWGFANNYYITKLT